MIQFHHLLPAGRGGGRQAAVLPRGPGALACPGPRLLGARERRLFPGPRLLLGRGRLRRCFQPPARPPAPRRPAASDRAARLPCGAGCRPAPAAWPGRAAALRSAPPVAGPACAAPVPAYSRKEAGGGGRQREMAAPRGGGTGSRDGSRGAARAPRRRGPVTSARPAGPSQISSFPHMLKANNNVFRVQKIDTLVKAE